MWKRTKEVCNQYVDMDLGRMRKTHGYEPSTGLAMDGCSPTESSQLLDSQQLIATWFRRPLPTFRNGPEVMGKNPLVI